MKNKILEKKIINYLNTNQFFTIPITKIAYKSTKEIYKLFPNYKAANLLQSDGQIHFLGGKNMEILYVTIIGEEVANWQVFWEKLKKIKPKTL